MKKKEKGIMHSEEVDKSDGYRSLIPRSDKKALFTLPIKFPLVIVFHLISQNPTSYMC
jgi:hypothetical protein